MSAKRPQIVKLGTIDLGLVETTPVVWKDRLYRFEYVRPKYWANDTGDSYFRFVDHDTRQPGAAFAHGYHLGNVMVEEDTLIVTATDIWDGERVDIFCSDDMEYWETWNALDLPGYGLFNTSLCRADDGDEDVEYVLMFEVGKPPEVAGVRFTARFATSPDLQEWTLTSPECTYARERYTAPHCLRYLNGVYYNFYLEAHPDGWDQRVVRSRDLVHWEPSPLNPVLSASDEDKRIANPELTPEQVELIRNAVDVNNSDIDFCEYQGQTVINYSWGNQHGIEFLAEATYEGTLEAFLTGWYPE